MYYYADDILEFGICAPVITVMNILTIATSRRYRRSVQDQDSEIFRQKKKVEIRLSFVGFVVSTSYVTSVIFDVLVTVSQWNISLFAGMNSDALLTWYYRFFDIFTMCDPYLLLFLSPAVRAKFFQIFFCNHFPETAPTLSGIQPKQQKRQSNRLPPLVNVA